MTITFDPFPVINMASAIRLRAHASRLTRLTNQTVAAATRRRQFSSTPARHAADVKSLGVIGAGQMVSSYLPKYLGR